MGYEEKKMIKKIRENTNRKRRKTEEEIILRGRDLQRKRGETENEKVIQNEEMTRRDQKR